MLRSPSAGGVGDGPGRLLPGLELGFRLDIDEDRENVGIYNGLDLLSVAGCDIRNGPTGLPTHC